MHIYSLISVLFNGSPADFFGSFEGIETRGPTISYVIFGYDGGLQYDDEKS